MRSGDRLVRLVGLRDEGAGALEVALSRVGRANEARSAREQLDAQAAFERRDRARDRRRRYPEPAGAACKALLFGHRHEDGERVEPVHLLFLKPQ